MKALSLTARRSRKPVILSGVKYGAKLSTPAAAQALTPFTRFSLQMTAALLLGIALLAAFALGGDVALAAALTIALPLLIFAMRKGGVL